MRRSLRRTRFFVLIPLTCIIVPLSLIAQKDSGADLVRRYHRETSELTKRDLALKMIDAGVLKLHTTTRKDIVEIFGSDWQMFADDPEDERPYGIVHFAKQPSGPDTEQVPFVGWYLAIFFSPKSYVVVDWRLSNVHK
jgi:hypothetical protein